MKRMEERFMEALTDIMVSSHDFPGLLQQYNEIVGNALLKWEELGAD